MEASLAEIERVILQWDLVCQHIFSPILTGKWITGEYCHFQHNRQLESFFALVLIGTYVYRIEFHLVLISCFNLCLGMLRALLNSGKTM